MEQAKYFIKLVFALLGCAVGFIYSFFGVFVEFMEGQKLMVFLVRAKRIGSSLHICLKKEICNKVPELRNLKHNDELAIEIIETSKDLLGHTETIWIGSEEPNALIIKKSRNNIII